MIVLFLFEVLLIIVIIVLLLVRNKMLWFWNWEFYILRVSIIGKSFKIVMWNCLNGFNYLDVN